MTAQQYGELIAAASSDIRAHGAKADEYVAIPKLSAAPVVTRPEKAFGEHLTAMNTGLIALPHEAASFTVPLAHVVAWVDGALAWSVINQSGCVTYFGTAPTGCTKLPANLTMINALKTEAK